uniref:Uncharacterized protein n=1 Tax=Anguilla anguilla TaxID=7936 RepID=A0A0E9UIL3_ANGAN
MLFVDACLILQIQFVSHFILSKHPAYPAFVIFKCYLSETFD